MQSQLNQVSESKSALQKVLRRQHLREALQHHLQLLNFFLAEVDALGLQRVRLPKGALQLVAMLHQQAEGVPELALSLQDVGGPGLVKHVVVVGFVCLGERAGECGVGVVLDNTVFVCILVL